MNSESAPINILVRTFYRAKSVSVLYRAFQTHQIKCINYVITRQLLKIIVNFNNGLYAPTVKILFYF